MDLKSYAQTHLFSPMGIEVGEWIRIGMATILAVVGST